MNIKIKSKNLYGKTRHYAACPLAECFVRLIACSNPTRGTLTAEELRIIESIGVSIEYI